MEVHHEVFKEVDVHQSKVPRKSGKGLKTALKGLFTRHYRQTGDVIHARTDLASLLDKRTLDADIRLLKDYSFISTKSHDQPLEMHRLVQLAMQTWLREHCDDQWWQEKSIQRLNAAFPTGEYENTERCRALYPQVQLALSMEPQSQDALLALASVLYNAAWFATEQGLYSDAEIAARRSLVIYEGMGTKTAPDTLASMCMLASALHYQGKYEAAEEMERRALNGREKVLGEEHRDTLTSMSNLTSTYINQGRYDDAAELGEKVVEISKRVLGEEHPNTLTSMNNLALTYSYQGRYDAAAALQTKGLEISKRVLGEEHPDTLANMGNLASTYCEQGRYDDAAELGVNVLEIKKRVLGEEHPHTLWSMNNLAVIFYRQHRLQEARELMNECLHSQTLILGETHPHTISSATWLRIIEEALTTAACQETDLNVTGSTSDDIDREEDR